MTAAVVLALAAAIGLGFYNAWAWALNKRRPSIVLIHVLFGVGATAALAALFARAGLPEDPTSRQIAGMALAFLAAAVLLGLTAWLARRFSFASLVLVFHAVAGFVGFLLALALVGAH